MSRTNAPDEEQFILRLPLDVADRVRAVLRETPNARPEDSHMELRFTDENQDDRNGMFVLGEDAFPVSVRDLPCMVESFKTYDGSTIIKSNDVGQLVIARHQGEEAPEGLPRRNGRLEVSDGLTPPMRDVRKRFFKPEVTEQPEHLQAVEKALAVILSGGQPRQTDLHIEVVEEWVEEDADEESEVVAEESEALEIDTITSDTLAEDSLLLEDSADADMEMLRDLEMELANMAGD
mmetsp:Transcript_49359/g.91899  ORF Transcript_49359/g.91899 Transcript_49359/m.91899 type:complete len:235 (-) Transcript_49359:12-716(-)